MILGGEGGEEAIPRPLPLPLPLRSDGPSSAAKVNALRSMIQKQSKDVSALQQQVKARQSEKQELEASCRAATAEAELQAGHLQSAVATRRAQLHLVAEEAAELEAVKASKAKVRKHGIAHGR